MYEVKNTLDWVNDRLHVSEEKSDKLEDTPIDTIGKETEKVNLKKGKISGKCRTISSGLICV